MSGPGRGGTSTITRDPVSSLILSGMHTPEEFAPSGWDPNADQSGAAADYIDAAFAAGGRAVRLSGNKTYYVARKITVGNNQTLFCATGEQGAKVQAVAGFDKTGDDSDGIPKDRVVELIGSNSGLLNVNVVASLYNDIDCVVLGGGPNAFSPYCEHVKASGGRNGFRAQTLEIHHRHCLAQDCAEAGVLVEMYDYTAFDVSTNKCRHGFRSTAGYGSSTLFHFHAINSIERSFYLNGANSCLLFGCHSDTAGNDGFRIENCANVSLVGCWGFQSSNLSSGSPTYTDIVTDGTDIIYSARAAFNASRHEGKTVTQTVTDGTHPAGTIPLGATIAQVIDSYHARLSVPTTGPTTGLSMKLNLGAENTYGDYYFGSNSRKIILSGCISTGASYTPYSARLTATDNEEITFIGFDASKPASGGRLGCKFVECLNAFAPYNHAPSALTVSGTLAELTARTATEIDKGRLFWVTDLHGGTWYQCVDTGGGVYAWQQRTAGLSAVPNPNSLTSGQSSLWGGRETASSSALTISSGTMKLAYFTSKKTEAVNNIRAVSGSTAAAATPTLVRHAVYRVESNGDLTLLATTANSTSEFAAANSAYTRALSATVNLVEGQRYAIGTLVVSGATMPSLPGTLAVNSSTVTATDPRLVAAVTGLTDLPAGNVAAGTLANQAGLQYIEVLP